MRNEFFVLGLLCFGLICLPLRYNYQLLLLMKKDLAILLCLFMAITMSAQRVTDKLDRGLVAVPGQSGGIFVSWKVLGEEYYDVTYNLYCNGQKIASNLNVSNYTHSSGTTASKYSVAPVVRGVEQAQCAQVSVWAAGYKEVQLIAPVDRDGNDAASYYQVNDISLGDLNGDGVSEFIIKRPCSDAADTSQKIRFHHVDCYDINGNRLWWIDMGPNMLAGADEQWDVVCFDWDEDGKAEVLLRGADNMIIHHSDGTTTKIGGDEDTRWSGIEYTSTGNEYLLYLEGATGKPYQIGPSEHPNYMDYPLTRGQDSDWGTGIIGHRSTKHYFGAPYLDGRHASIFLGRGCYTQHKMIAYDVNHTTHQLTQRWYWESTKSGPWFGQGYHNFAVGDVDWDGKDEIIFGSMVIDDNGKGLSTTGLGHGDAQHCSDFDPYRKYEEQFACNETSPCMNYRNAVTSQIYYRITGGSDDGRALMGNFTNSYPGSTGRSVASGWISSVADKEISGLDLIPWGDLNARIYWDGDLLDEYMDSPGTARAAVVYKPGTGTRLVQCVGNLANSSKNNAGAIGDIFGDWREEMVLRYGDNAFVIYTTNYPTTYRIPTLWSDHQYRNAMVWQTMGYNQPPHKSYFLGQLEGITVAPPTNTMTNRVEIANGGTITSQDEHLIVCEMNDTKINIQDGAAPYMITFYVPSKVEGTAESNTTIQNTPINYSYYTCDVTGGALTGTMRLVKQGDGILNLPAVDMAYTGETNIWAGTLNFNGTLKQSPLWLNRFAELNSDGGEFKSIKADYGSVIRPGGAGNAGTITVDSLLSLGFGSRIVLDVYSEGFKADKINTEALSIEKKTAEVWQNYGPAYIQPVIEIVEHKIEGATTLESGDYIIGKVKHLTGSLANIKIEGVTDLKAGLSIDADSNIVLTLGSVRGASEITWTGASSNVWDYAKSTNFYDFGDTAKVADYFVKGDIVNFTDEATTTTVNIEDDVVADTVRFSNSTKNYTLSGIGSIQEGSAFVKEGTGSVRITNENSYTGGNYLRGGTIIINALANDNKANGNLGAKTTLASKFTMENGATLQNSESIINGSPIKFVGIEGGVINNSGSFTQNASFSGTLLTKKGTGWLTINNAGTVSKMIVAAGTVNATAKPANAVELQGMASIMGSGFTTTPINVASGAKATLTTVNRSTTSLALTGDGQITVYSAAEQGNGWVATRTPLKLNMSKFEGTLVASAAIASDGRFTFDTSSGGDGWTLNIPSGVYVQNSGKTLRIGQLTGEGSLGGFSSFSNNSTASANTWQVGNDSTNFTFGGVVTGSDKFTKVGDCKMTVKGVWDNTGAITIADGELHVNSGATLGTGALTVSKDAILSGVGSLTNSLFTVNGTLQVGALPTSFSGSLDMGSKNVTIGVQGTYQTCARKGATESNAGCAYMTNVKTLTVNGTVKVVLSRMSTLTVGDSIKVFQAEKITGNPKFDLPNVFVWDTSHIKEGLLRIIGRNDINNDGMVDTQDVLQIYDYMRTHDSGDATGVVEDANNDGVVDTQDVLQIYDNIRDN